MLLRSVWRYFLFRGNANNFYLLILRAIAMFVMAAHGLYFILVPLMALLLSYPEIWPERAMAASR